MPIRALQKTALHKTATSFFGSPLCFATKKWRFILFFSVLVFSGNPAAADPSETKKSQGTQEDKKSQEAILRSAHNTFEYGQFEKTVKILRPIIERGMKLDRADRIEALRIYGISLHLSGRKEGALIVFRKIVALDPTLRLSPRLVPPQVVESFELVRKETLKKEVRQLEPMKPKYAVLNFFPPAGQFQNGQHIKAWSLLGAEVGLLAINAASIAILRSSKYRHDGSFVIQDIDGNIVEDNRTLAKTMLAVNYVSFGLLVGVFIYGVIDGYIEMRKQIKKEKARRRFLQNQLVFFPSGAPQGGALNMKMRF